MRTATTCQPLDMFAQQLLGAASIMCLFCVWYWGIQGDKDRQVPVIRQLLDVGGQGHMFDRIPTT